MKNSDGKRKEPTWKEVGEAMERWGWFMSRVDEKIAIFERGRQKIVARRVGKKNWKVEYYTGKIMDDMAGITNSYLAKREAMEMGVVK